MPASRDSLGEVTDRALEVLRVLATGDTYQEAADALFVSVSTVRWHVDHAYHALEVHNLQQALLAAGIVTIAPAAGTGATAKGPGRKSHP